MNEPSAGHEREGLEPEELHNPLPRWYAMLAIGFIGWGALYFYGQISDLPNAGDHRTVIRVDTNAVSDGSAVYSANCASCHQANGQGITGAFPPLDDSRWVNANIDIPAQILLHGVSGSMVVKGEIYNGVMPSMAHLSDADIAAVLNYIRSSWSNSASVVNAEGIAAQRKRFSGRTTPWAGGAEINDLVGSLTTPQ